VFKECSHRNYVFVEVPLKMQPCTSVINEVNCLYWHKIKGNYTPVTWTTLTFVRVTVVHVQLQTAPGGGGGVSIFLHLCTSFLDTVLREGGPSFGL